MGGVTSLDSGGHLESQARSRCPLQPASAFSGVINIQPRPGERHLAFLPPQSKSVPLHFPAGQAPAVPLPFEERKAGPEVLRMAPRFPFLRFP